MRWDAGTSLWDYHVAVAALGLSYYGPVNKAGLPRSLGCFLSLYMSTFLFILLQIVWQPAALENPNSLMLEISTKTQEAEGILVRERERALQNYE